MICLKVGDVKWVFGKCLDFAMGWNAHREGLLHNWATPSSSYCNTVVSFARVQFGLVY